MTTVGCGAGVIAVLCQFRISTTSLSVVFWLVDATTWIVGTFGRVASVGLEAAVKLRAKIPAAATTIEKVRKVGLLMVLPWGRETIIESHYSDCTAECTGKIDDADCGGRNSRHSAFFTSNNQRRFPSSAFRSQARISSRWLK